MKLASPAPGNSVELLVTRGMHTDHLLAQVADETEKGLILSTFEAPEGVKIPEPDAPLRVRFHQKDSGYEFDSVVLARKESPVRLAYIAKPVTLSRRQLRAYLRVDCEIPVTLIRRDDPRRHPIAGVITNLSGGGLLIALTITVPPDVTLELKFELDEGGTTVSNITGRVLSIRNGEQGTRVHVIQFEGIDDESRTAIIRHTFKLQHRQSRKSKASEE